MSDTVLTFDDIFDNRKDLFTNVITPEKIGLGDRAAERRTIPSVPPYQIKLYHVPIQQVPSRTVIELVSTGESLLEKSKVDTPADMQFRLNYDEENVGIAEFSSAQKGLQVDISYYAQMTVIRKQTFQFQLTGIGATIVLASSDSEVSSKGFVDSIISTTQDAGAIINNYFDELTANGGGRIILQEGTYKAQTKILPKTNVDFFGCGNRTIIERAAAISEVIYINAQSNITLAEFKIDGKKGIYTGAGNDGIEENASTNIKYYNIESYQNKRNGFRSCRNLIGCFADENDSQGFVICYNMSCCNSNKNEIGFETCFEISSSYAYDNIINGFQTCKQVSSCRSYDNGDEGFFGCYNISACISISNGDNGYRSCRYISGCMGESNTGNGYDSCFVISGSVASLNSTDGFDGCENVTGCWPLTNVNGFDGCKPIQTNYSTGNSGANYNNSFADRAGANAVADTAAGGYNG